MSPPLFDLSSSRNYDRSVNACTILFHEINITVNIRRNKQTCENEVKVKVILRPTSVGQSVLVSGHHLEHATSNFTSVGEVHG
jgi:hypothetical protein